MSDFQEPCSKLILDFWCRRPRGHLGLCSKKPDQGVPVMYGRPLPRKTIIQMAYQVDTPRVVRDALVWAADMNVETRMDRRWGAALAFEHAEEHMPEEFAAFIKSIRKNKDAAVQVAIAAAQKAAE